MNSQGGDYSNEDVPNNFDIRPPFAVFNWRQSLFGQSGTEHANFEFHSGAGCFGTTEHFHSTLRGARACSGHALGIPPPTIQHLTSEHCYAHEQCA